MFRDSRGPRVSSFIVSQLASLQQGLSANVELVWHPTGLTDSPVSFLIVPGVQVNVWNILSLGGCWGFELGSSCLCSSRPHPPSSPPRHCRVFVG